MSHLAERSVRLDVPLMFTRVTHALAFILARRTCLTFHEPHQAPTKVRKLGWVVSPNKCCV